MGKPIVADKYPWRLDGCPYWQKGRHTSNEHEPVCPCILSLNTPVICPMAVSNDEEQNKKLAQLEKEHRKLEKVMEENTKRDISLEEKYELLSQLSWEMFQQLESAYIRGIFSAKAYAEYRDRLEEAGVESYGFKTEVDE